MQHLPLQLKKTTYWYKVMCGYECFILSKSMHYYLLIFKGSCLNHLKYRSHNAQNRRSGEISSCIFETYNNAVVNHGCHIYNTAADMAMEKMSPCTYENHGIPQCKCVLCCFEKCPSIFLPIKESNKGTTNMCTTIRFHVYCNVLSCTVHRKSPYHEQKTWSLWSTVASSDSTAKVYTLKELVLLLASITEFHEKNYIPAIKRLVFHLPYVSILGTHHCGKERCK